MGWTTIPQTLVNVGKAVVQTLMQYIKDDLDYLYGQIGTISTGLQNGSFEIDSDSDGIPDSWTRGLYPGGTGGFYTTAPAHGQKAYQFVHPGGVSNGGGYLDSGYVAVGSLITRNLTFIHWATNAAMKNQVYVRYFDKDKIYISEAVLYSSTTNPTSSTKFTRQYLPPSTARFIQVRVIGGFTDTNQAGTAYFDGVETEEVITGDRGAVISLATSMGLGNGTYWTPTDRGTYVFTPSPTPTITILWIEIYVSGSWRAYNTSIGSVAGSFTTDGSNVRIYTTTSGGGNTGYYLRF